ncbi:MAG: type II toxin-antitoxin system PemK/MazF family toxin [Blastocatellia bacterium]
MKLGHICSWSRSGSQLFLLRPNERQTSPAIVLAHAGRNDWVLCQITSKPYADSSAIKIESADFSSGSLHKTSFARPTKIFTANSGIMTKHIGYLSHDKFNEIVRSVLSLFEASLTL